MRHGTTFWQAVVLLGLVHPVLLHAAAPPVETRPDECSGSGAWELYPVAAERERQATAALHAWFAQCQASQRQRQENSRAAAHFFAAQPPADFARAQPREYTIVVRVQEKQVRHSFGSLPGSGYRSVAMPPDHAILTSGWEGAEKDRETVIETLQHKLQELHAEGVFEVSIDPLPFDRMGVSIQYQSVYEQTHKPADRSRFISPGFTR
jgi:hypothetical protein